MPAPDSAEMSSGREIQIPAGELQSRRCDKADYGHADASAASQPTVAAIRKD